MFLLLLTISITTVHNEFYILEKLHIGPGVVLGYCKPWNGFKLFFPIQNAGASYIKSIKYRKKYTI